MIKDSHMKSTITLLTLVVAIGCGTTAPQDNITGPSLLTPLTPFTATVGEDVSGTRDSSRPADVWVNTTSPESHGSYRAISLLDTRPRRYDGT